MLLNAFKKTFFQACYLIFLGKVIEADGLWILPEPFLSPLGVEVLWSRAITLDPKWTRGDKRKPDLFFKFFVSLLRKGRVELPALPSKVHGPYW